MEGSLGGCSLCLPLFDKLWVHNGDIKLHVDCSQLSDVYIKLQTPRPSKKPIGFVTWISCLSVASRWL